MRLLRAMLVSLVIPVSVAAQNPQTREGFGISFGLGTGSAGAECDGCSSDRENGLSGYLRLGGYVRPHVFLAFESTGWTFSQDGIDETLGFYMGVVQWYPNPDRGLFLKGGVGLSRYLATDGFDDVTGSGLGLSLGLGYDIRVGKNFSLTPYANFLSSTKSELEVNDVSSGLNVSANLLQIGLGFTWH